MPTYRHCLCFLSLLLPLGLAKAEAASFDELLNLSVEELGQLEVSIATGAPQALKDAPAVVSVISQQELQKLGVQDLESALKALPGLHISFGGIMYGARYFFRGIYANTNPHTLMLVNGIAHNGTSGGRPLAWQGVPIAAIERIEVVRGPASALYGADAFAGVINIITKSATATEQDNEVTLAYGSFDTRHASWLQRGNIGNIKALAMLDYKQSDGADSIITKDYATGFDKLMGTSSSHAPNRVNRQFRTLDLRTELALQQWKLRSSWQEVWDLGTGAGLVDALDPIGRGTGRFINLDLLWNNTPKSSQEWALDSRLAVNYYGFAMSQAFNLLPPNTFCFPKSPSCFPQGMKDDFATQSIAAFASVNALKQVTPAHRLRLGAGFYLGDLYNSTDYKNFDSSQAGGLPKPLGAMFDVSDTPLTFLPEAQRTSHYLLLQDEWTWAKNWALTAGIRHDRYADVGSTTNPRLALVWQSSPTLTTKLLYGEAFRPPSFAELYVQTVGALGNPDLRPEELRNLELALNWRPIEALTADVNLFHYRIRDFIQLVPDPQLNGTIHSQNFGRLEGKGAEIEIRYQLPIPVQLLANFSTARMDNEDTGNNRGQTPRQMAVVRANWDINPQWQWSGQLKHIGDFERDIDGTPPDLRSDLKGYQSVDMSLRTLLSKKAEVGILANNIFDVDVKEPSNSPSPPQTTARLPDDLPQAGRSVTVYTKIKW